MTWRSVRIWLVFLSAFIAILWVTLADSGFRHRVDQTAALASWAVAAGTLFLALATFQLARRARDEAEAVRREAEQVGTQVTLQREQMEASARAYVYPWTPHDWVAGSDYWGGGRNATLLPLKNGGTGLALNVRGRAVWNLGPGIWHRVEIYAGTIAANDDLNARLSQDATQGWVGATGYLRYTDLRNQPWVTFFRFDRGEGDRPFGLHLPPARITDENDPDRLDDANIARHGRRSRPSSPTVVLCRGRCPEAP
jgi:hypothetical protein